MQFKLDEIVHFKDEYVGEYRTYHSSHECYKNNSYLIITFYEPQYYVIECLDCRWQMTISEYVLQETDRRAYDIWIKLENKLFAVIDKMQ